MASSLSNISSMSGSLKPDNKAFDKKAPQGRSSNHSKHPNQTNRSCSMIIQQQPLLNDTCPICIEPFSDTDTPIENYRFLCEHKTHNHCLKELVNNNLTFQLAGLIATKEMPKAYDNIILPKNTSDRETALKELGEHDITYYNTQNFEPFENWLKKWCLLPTIYKIAKKLGIKPRCPFCRTNIVEDDRAGFDPTKELNFEEM